MKVTEFVTRERFDASPDYVKMYNDGVPGTFDIKSNLIYPILKYMDYQNIITFPKNDLDKFLVPKDKIKEDVKELCEKGFLVKEGRGKYLVNPYIFARASWEIVLMLRDKYDELIKAKNKKEGLK